MIEQVVYDTSQIVHLAGVKNVVLCPGSRNAPLIYSFTQNRALTCFSAIDERSAAFIALGIALKTQSPAVVCCTSGTALLNFASACAEAFYQRLPLIIISADRPPEWIDQGDGQTIRQIDALKPHVKKSYQLPVDTSHPEAQWEYRRKLNEALLLSKDGVPGPVHINIPFREPFYPESNQELTFSHDLKAIRNVVGQRLLTEDQSSTLESAWLNKKKIVVVGQGNWQPMEIKALEALQQKGIPIVADVTSNCHSLPEVITQHDLFLGNRDHWKTLQPDIVLTLGNALISKNLKLFLRQGVEHWHIGIGSEFQDTFKSLSVNIQADVGPVLNHLASINEEGLEKYHQQWHELETQTSKKLQENLAKTDFSDISAFSSVMESLPSGYDIHLANSMAVRYANFFSPKGLETIFYSNRGTSGIDGSTSTAVGISLVSNKKQLLLSGDLSFLYDRNAFLNEMSLKHFQVIVFNNQGGGIFDLIPGPDAIPSEHRRRYLQTVHQRDMVNIAKEAGLTYYRANTEDELTSLLPTFFRNPKALLEIVTEESSNKKAFIEARKGLK